MDYLVFHLINVTFICYSSLRGYCTSGSSYAYCFNSYDCLNGIAGVVFGWLFWKTGLEVAMIAHATVHITISFLVWLTLII
ncbi:CPBP family intramembrane metalloprotease [Priestia megaterium]|nr:CPBP family intramembrane metalloprotease [Priestia megaterium]